MCFASIDSPATRARLTRKILETLIAGRPGCQVCVRLGRVEARLAQTLRRKETISYVDALAK